jgi:hypothetical protein
MMRLRMQLALSALTCACATEASPTFAPNSEQEQPGQDASTARFDGGASPGNGTDTGYDAAAYYPMMEPENCQQDIDLVLVADVSGSMVPALSKLMDEVDKVDKALVAKGLPSPPHYGLVIFVDDVVVMNGGAPYASIEAFKAAVNVQIQATQTNPARQATDALEPNLSWPENSLDALYAAATKFQWRDAASTHRTIIHITDASFWDLKAVSSAAGDPMHLEPAGGCSVGAGVLGNVCTMVSSMHSYDETIEALRAAKVWANTFAAKTGGPPSTTPAPASHGAFRGVDVDVGIGFHEPYNGKPSIAKSSGGLSWDLDEVYDGKISLATPITDAIAQTQCMEYPVF